MAAPLRLEKSPQLPLTPYYDPSFCRGLFLDPDPRKGEWINLKGEPIFFVYVPQGWTEGTKQEYPASWLSPHLQQSRRGPQNKGRRAGQSNLAPGLCNIGNMVSEDLGDPPTEWREAKECQGWVCWGYSEEGEVQVEDPGICQLQTSLSPLSARRNEELTLPPVLLHP